MPDPIFFIREAERIIQQLQIIRGGALGFGSKPTVYDMLLDTEVLFFGYARNYPGLVDIAKLKVKLEEGYDIDDSINDELIPHLERFNKFVNDQHYTI